MCNGCVGITQRNYSLGSWFFYSLAAMFALVDPVVVASELRHFGARTAMTDAALLGLVIGIAAGAGFSIRYFGRRVV